MKASLENWSNSIKIFCALAALALACAANAAEVNSIVAKVGDSSITSVELDRYVNPTLKSYMKMMPDDPQLREEYNLERVEALKGIIDSKLLVREANKLEFSIPPMEIDKQLSKERERYASEEEFQDYLKENKITLQEFKEHLSDSIKAQAVLQEKVFKRVRVLPHEIHKFYVDNKSLLYSRQPSVHLYQILIKEDPSGEKGDPAARIAEVKNQLAAGANFQQLALMYSEGPMRASGGDWGLIEQGHFGEEMAAVESAAFTLAPGTYSDVIRTRFGYHIVYVSAKNDAHVQTEREAYDDIYRRVAESKSATVYEPYMNGLRRSCSIEIFDPELMAAKPEIKPGKKIGDFMTRKLAEAESAPQETAVKTVETVETTETVETVENAAGAQTPTFTETVEIKTEEETVSQEKEESVETKAEAEAETPESKKTEGEAEAKTETPSAPETKPEEKSEPVASEIKPVETGAKPTDDDNVVWTEIQPASEVTEKAAEESKETEQKEEDPFTELEQKMEQNMADPGLPGAAPQPSSPLFEMKEVK